MDGLEARPIPGTEGGHGPFFSPDGQWVGFSASGKLKKVSLSSGTSVSLADITTGQLSGISWGSQGMIAFAPQVTGTIQQIPDTGGNPQPLTLLVKGESSHRWPEFLPGGKGLLFMANQGTNAKIVAQTAGASEHRDLMQSGTEPHYARSGHLVFSQGSNLLAVPFDPQKLTITGAVVPVVEGVVPGEYSLSSTGSLVYVPGSVQGAGVKLKLLWVDRKGTEQPLGAPAHNYVLPKVSPDGKRVAAGIEEADSKIWLYDLSRDTLTRLTFEGNTNIDPVWTPDGKRIVFKGNGNRLFWQPADGSGGAELLTTSELS